jgi:cell division protein FtsB
MRNIRKEKVRHRKKLRGLILLTLGILLFIYISLSLLFSENGLVRYMKLKSKKSGLVAEIEVIEERNREVSEQVEGIKKDPEQIEELAREHGLTREGELIFKYEEER